MSPPTRHLPGSLTTMRMATLFVFGFALPCGAQPAPVLQAQEAGDPAQIEKERFVESRRGKLGNSLASEWIDVTYYRLDLRVSLSPTTVTGKVTIRGLCTQNHPASLTLDLMNAMRIDSVIISGREASVTQQPTAFTLLLDSAYSAGETISLDVYYHGAPVATGLGSFVTSSHSTIPWVWTLSEPYGARDWWPCKDHPTDKADSVDILVTCDSSFSVGSNGRLESVVTNSDGTRTTFWKERYPIATYLVSIDITNFAHFSNWFHYTPTDSLEVLNYVIPERLAAAQSQLPLAVDGLDIFSRLFGLYPFIKEKYGHSQFLSGGMEHQTMTSITTFAEETIIHELAHQWFGDMITCGSWSHLWLNEGFATYCTALYEEQKYGAAAYRQFMSPQLNRALSASGSVFGHDTTDISELFRNARVYAKGAAVLHMLRHVLGDSLFYRSMHAYANDSTVRFKSAVSEDFQRACEAASGRSLGFFFSEWIYGENYPSYSYKWSNFDSGGTKFVKVALSQSTGTSNPAFFTMPLDVKLIGGSWDSTVTIVNDRQTQAYVIAVPLPIDSVLLDPDDWVLKHAADVSKSPLPTEYSLAQNYPNPFNASTEIDYELPRRVIVNLAVYDVIGRKIATLVSATQNPGTYLAHWDATNVATGVYFIRLEAVSAVDASSSQVLVRKMLLVK